MLVQALGERAATKMSDPADTTKVLVPFDGSLFAEHAIPYGRAVAGKEGQIIVLEVLPEPEPMRGLLGDTVASAEEVTEIFDTETRARMASLLEKWKPIVGDFDTKAATGDPKEQIVKYAVDHACDYIVVASRGKGAMRRFFFGSVADAVARTSPLPVLIFRPDDEKFEPVAATATRLIVPLDGSDLARAALSVVADLANHLGVPALLLHALDMNVVASAYQGSEVYYSAELYDDMINEQKSAAEAELGSAAEELKKSGVETSWIIINGGAVPAIEQQLQYGDIIVMTSHGRSGIKRWVMGSVAERLVRTGPVPVMLVPAPGREEAEE
jgi:nucleotide-binding universal stress UspA family protein